MLHEKHVMHVLSEICLPWVDKRQAPDRLGNFYGYTSWKEVVKVRNKKSVISRKHLSVVRFVNSLNLNSLVSFDRKKSHSFRIVCNKSAVRLLERAEKRYIKANN